VPKRGCFGFSFPLIIGILLVLLVLFVIGFISGPLGRNMFGDMLPGWLSVPRPELHLPAETVFHIFGFPITNSVVAAWLTVIILVGFSFAVTRRLKIIPSRVQAFLEFALEWLLNFCQRVAGERNGRRFFPVVATIFLFVIINAWLSLLPGFGSILIINPEGETVHLLRAANTDINMPLALAIMSFLFVSYFGLRSLGVSYLGKFINVRQFARGLRQLFSGKIVAGFSGVFTGVINMFIGFVEALSQFIRIISFTFRLFGNMTAGEILLLMATFLVPFLFALPFYGLEILIGFVQALIFGGLTLIFLTVAVTSHEEGNHHEEEKSEN